MRRLAKLSKDAGQSRRLLALVEIYDGGKRTDATRIGDAVILDNVAFHKSTSVVELLRENGVWLLFLPPYSPDLNPIELAYSKLKALLRKRAARSFDAICVALADICDLFTPDECRNFFTAAGYEAH